jgi:hypothetical protein
VGGCSLPPHGSGEALICSGGLVSPQRTPCAAVCWARRCLEHSESGVPGSVLSPSDLSALRDHLQKLPEGEGVAPGGIEAPSEATGRLEKPDEPPVGNPSPPCRSNRRYTRKELLSLRAAAPVALPEALPEVLVAPTKNSEAPEEYSIGSSSNPPVGPPLRYRKEELLRLRKSPNVPRGESLLPSVPPELRTKTVSLSAEEAVAPG